MRGVNDLVYHPMAVTPEMRRRLDGYKPFVLWLTGLSGAGKSSLASEVERRLVDAGYRTVVLDGDNVRQGLNSDLGFADADRAENIRRIGEVAKLMLDAGLITLVSVISPLASHRARAKSIIGEDAFVEVYLECALEVCESRDPKGFYRRARQNSLAHFTGVSSDYEPPLNPSLRVDTARLGIGESAKQVLAHLIDNQRLIAPDAGALP